MFDLNFVINRKVISLHKEIKYVERDKCSLDDFSAKHMLHATLSMNADYLPFQAKLVKFWVKLISASHRYQNNACCGSIQYHPN